MGVSFASIEDGASGGGTVKIGGDVGADLQPQNHSSSFLFFSFLFFGVFGTSSLMH